MNDIVDVGTASDFGRGLVVGGSSAPDVVIGGPTMS